MYKNLPHTEGVTSSLTYTANYLNLPSVIFMGNGREIQFYYTADGELLRKLVYDPAGVEGYWQEYINGVEYKNWSMSRFTHPEGAVVLNATGGYEYEYVLKDHLGNNRVVFSDKNNDRNIDATDIKDINNYYPFGLDMEGNWKIVSDNKYKFNGKELTSEFGLGWYNYGARFYDPAIGRWNAVDPLSEKMPRHSPYNYAFDNPIRFVDPDGSEPTDTRYYSSNGALLYTSYDKLDNAITIIDEDDVNAFYAKQAAISDPYGKSAHTNEVNTVLRKMGTTYDEASMIGFSKDDKRAVDTKNYKPTDGKGPLRAEVLSTMIPNADGVKVVSKFRKSDGQPDAVSPIDINTESGEVQIHLHPGEPGRTWTANGISQEDDLIPGPSGWDTHQTRKGEKTTKANSNPGQYNVVIESGIIFFYGFDKDGDNKKISVPIKH